MTLIVSLQAQDCIVFAADSLTSVGGRVRNCNTVKVHNLWGYALVGGWAGTAQKTWHDVFKVFKPPVAAGTTPANSAAMLIAIKASLDQLVSLPGKSNVMAFQGGNTFLVATLDPASSSISVNRFARNGDFRVFQPSVTISLPGNANYIEFIGHMTYLQACIAVVTQIYVQCISNGMSQADAITFAQDAIKNAIPIDRKAEG